MKEMYAIGIYTWFALKPTYQSKSRRSAITDRPMSAPNTTCVIARFEAFWWMNAYLVGSRLSLRWECVSFIASLPSAFCLEAFINIACRGRVYCRWPWTVRNTVPTDALPSNEGSTEKIGGNRSGNCFLYYLWEILPRSMSISLRGALGRITQAEASVAWSGVCVDKSEFVLYRTWVRNPRPGSRGWLTKIGFN